MFSHAGNLFHLRASDESWTIHQDDRAPAIAMLTRTHQGWAVIPPEDDREWRDDIHFLAVAAFLDELEPASPGVVHPSPAASPSTIV